MRFVVMADDGYAELWAMAVASIRHHHPQAEIIQIADEKSTELPGGDGIWRCRGRYKEPWYSHEYVALLAEMDSTPTAIIGSDTLTRKPLDDVWQHEFDVALTWRPDVPKAPYNTGIVFCRTPAFYGGVLQRMADNPKLARWGGDQKAVAQEAESGRWKVRTLLCAEWNNSEMDEGAIPDARMLHYKGARKQYMARHFAAGVWR